VLRCGSVLMQVSQPRMPCYKQARRVGQPDFVKLILQSGKPGFLTRILEPGTIQVGDALELVERSLPEVPLLFVLRVFQKPDPESAALLAGTTLLANEWRERFASMTSSASQ
jgi:MOSC domain-containing protein YiiM